jgi:hypothetical protein
MSASTGTTVAVLVGVLVVLGLAMIGVAVWLVRSTREDPPALGPLEVMGERRWRRGDADRRRTNLDTARPPGAPPPAPILAFEAPVAAAGAGDGDVEAAGESGSEANLNCDASVQESARSGHSSPAEPADAGSEDGVESPAVEPAAEESAVSVPGSEDPADAGSDAEADSKE